MTRRRRRRRRSPAIVQPRSTVLWARGRPAICENRLCRPCTWRWSLCPRGPCTSTRPSDSRPGWSSRSVGDRCPRQTRTGTRRLAGAPVCASESLAAVCCCCRSSRVRDKSRTIRRPRRRNSRITTYRKLRPTAPRLSSTQTIVWKYSVLNR